MAQTTPQLKHHDEIHCESAIESLVTIIRTLDVVAKRYDGNANFLICYFQYTLRAFFALHSVRTSHVTSKALSEFKTCTIFYNSIIVIFLNIPVK
jgi:hypothetical protein